MYLKASRDQFGINGLDVLILGMAESLAVAACFKVAQNRPAAIDQAVIDNQLEVRKALRQNAFHGLARIDFNVIDRQNNADGGVWVISTGSSHRDKGPEHCGRPSRPT